MILQAVHLNAPPAHEYVVQATVPILGGADGLTLRLDNYPTDTSVVAHARGWTIYELTALAAAGDGSFDVHPGPRALPRADVATLHRYAVTPGLVRLRIDSTIVSLTGAPQDWHRRGNVYRQMHRHVALGAYGWAHVWIGMRAGTEQLDFSVLLHNGIPGPDRRFHEIEVLAPVPMTATIPSDSSISPPYLVRYGEHTLPQEFARPFYFSVGLTAEPEHVAIADWSEGGYLPSALPVSDAVPATPLPLAEQRWRLASLAPDPDYTGEPVSALWPASRYVGSIGRYPLDGVRWIASGEGLEYYRIRMLRDCSRARVRFDPDGSPLDVPATQTWTFFDGFLTSDAPWNWPPPQWGLPNDPRSFPDFEQEELTHRAEVWPLVWLANDPLARLLALEMATRSLLTWRNGPTELGTCEAQGALAVAFARCLGATEYEPWTGRFRSTLRARQMPSGCLVGRIGGYPSDHPPFHGEFMLQGALEFATLQLAAYSLGGVDDVLRECARGMVGLATDGVGPDEMPGLYYFTATGTADGECFVDKSDWPPALFDVIGDGNPGDDSSYYTFFDMGYAAAIARAVGAPEADELLMRATGRTSVSSARAYLATWGVLAPIDQAGTPVEQWWPLLGE